MAVPPRLREARLLAAALLLVAAPLAAQNPGAIRGIVTDAVTGAPLPDVEITVVGSDVVGSTNKEGAYLLAAVPPGLVKVSAQAIGYLPITTAYYSIRPDSVIQVDFRLAPISVPLEPLEVRGRRTERAENHFGARVLTREELPARGNILDALNGVVAGIDSRGRREDTRTRARGSLSEVLFVVDGVTITPPLTFYIDSQDVHCVEVRRGYHAAAEFRPSISGQTYSGVIIIWTRGSVAPMPASCNRQSSR